MGVRRQSKHGVAAKLHGRYLAADREEKGRLLDEFVALTDYHRKYAIALSRHGPPRGTVHVSGAGHPLVYGPGVVGALRVAAEATGWICGKRLAPFLAELVPALEQEGALTLSEAERAALLSMSAATIDRRLKMARIGEKPARGLCTAKPGSLLKKQVPARTFTPWDEQRAGFVEIDLVAHCGTSTAGRLPVHPGHGRPRHRLDRVRCGHRQEPKGRLRRLGASSGSATLPPLGDRLR